jgi:polysaccharide pyruvyl transferase WcaK-like protein
VSAVPIDTRLDENSTGLRTPREVESLIARMDVVVTTRLHGTVLALKNGVPVVAIDPISGGAKIKRQAETVGWPIVFTADALDAEELQSAFNYCLSDEARQLASATRNRARQRLGTVRAEFLDALVTVPSTEGE